MYSGIYTSNVFEYMIIEAASHIAKEGAFIIPQMSAPCVYSGTDCSRWLKEGRARRFEKQTGITLDFNVGIDTSYYIVTTVEKRYKGHHQRKRQREGFFSKSASAKPRNVR